MALQRPATATLVVCLVVAFAGMAAPCSAAARRIALVIGNSDYQQVDPLLNPANDARSVGAALIDAGFDRVDVRTNLDQASMVKALSAFEAAADGVDAAVIYYAGHGIQLHGENWLIPVDAALGGESVITRQSIPMREMIDALKRARGTRILILDACRNNRFNAHSKEAEVDAAGRRIVVRGLSSPSASGVLIAYAAKAGTPALDGDGPNSPFAKALSRRIAEPGVDVTRLFGEVRDDVLTATGGRQEPSIYGAVDGEGYLAPPNPEITLQDAEGRGWTEAISSDSIESYRDYLHLFPKGRHWADAAILEAQRVAGRMRRGASGFSGRTLKVSADGGGDFATLDRALSAARPGDHIVLGPGTFPVRPSSLDKPIFISGPPPGHAPAVLTGVDFPTGALHRTLFLVRDGASRLQDISITCSCQAFMMMAGAVALIRVDLEGSSITSSPGTRIDLVDSTVNGLQVGGDMFAVNNTVNGGVSSVSDGDVVLFGNRLQSGGQVLSFMSTGRMVVEGNTIDARGLKANEPYRKFSLFYLRRADGRLVVRRNNIRLPRTFDETQWTQCIDSQSCDVVLQDNRRSTN